jgi:hypothetical protein
MRRPYEEGADRSAHRRSFGRSRKIDVCVMRNTESAEALR